MIVNRKSQLKLNLALSHILRLSTTFVILSLLSVFLYIECFNNYPVGFPSVFFYGLVTTVDCEILVMQKLGPSLDDLLMKCNRKFSMKTTLLLANQIV